jgi:hypothetical protein
MWEADRLRWGISEHGAVRAVCLASNTERVGPIFAKNNESSKTTKVTLMLSDENNSIYWCWAMNMGKAGTGGGENGYFGLL